MGDAEIDPSGVGGDVVDAAWGDLAEFGDSEVVHPDRLGLPFGAQFTPAVLEVANELPSAARGVSPRAAHRSVRETLASYGSCHSLKAAAFRRHRQVHPVSR